MNLELEIGIAKLEPDAITPTQGTAQAAGWDLYALEETIIKKYSKGKLLGKGGFAKCFEFTKLESKILFDALK